MDKRWRSPAIAAGSTLIALGVVVAVGTSSSSGAAPPSSDASPVAALYEDKQMPLEEFFGVPTDPAEAAAWDHDMVQRGIVECMAERGWSYNPVPFESTTKDGPGTSRQDAANAEILAELSDEQRERYGVDLLNHPDRGVVSCEDVSYGRSHPLNALESEYDAMLESVWSDSNVRAARSDWFSCAGLSQEPTYEEMERVELALRESCSASTGLGNLLANQSYEAQAEFLDAYRQVLTELREDRP